MGRVVGYVEYNQSGVAQYERYGIVHDLRGQVIAEKGRTLLAKTNGGFDTLYTHTVNNYSATGFGPNSPPIESAGAVGSSTGSILTYSETKNWLNGSSNLVYGAGGFNYSRADTDYADAYTRYSYSFYEAEVQASVQLTNRDGSTSSGFVYDGLGRLSNVNVGGPRAHVLNYVNDINGQVISRSVTGGPGTAKPVQYYHYYNGIMLGSNGNNGNDRPDMATALNERIAAGPTTPGVFRNGGTGPNPYADFDQAYEAVSPETLAQGPSAYTVRSGDSLESIAAQIWGDASLWYMLAEANPSAARGNLNAGTSLIIPNKVANFHNTSDTFRPYDAERAVGDTQPGTPKPKVQKGACGTFGQILQAIVTIAVTVALSFTPLAPVAPIIGNAVGQGFGIVTGIQRGGFNWKSLGMTALTLIVPNPIGGILGAAVTNAAVQGIGVAIGLQDRFSWAGVAAAGVGAAVGSINFGSGAVGQIVATAADVLAQAATRSIIEGSDFGDNIIAQLPSAIGNLAGRAIGKGIATAYDGKSGSAPVTGGSSAAPQAGSNAPGNAATNAEQKAAEQSATTNDEIIVTATRRQSYMYEGINFLQYRPQGIGELIDSPFTPLSAKIRLSALREDVARSIDTDRRKAAAEAKAASDAPQEGDIVVTARKRATEKKEESNVVYVPVEERFTYSRSQNQAWKAQFLADYPDTPANRLKYGDYTQRLESFDQHDAYLAKLNDLANDQINREFGGFLLLTAGGAAAAAATPVVAGWAATTYGGSSVVYYGTTATLGGGSGYGLGYARDWMFDALDKRTTGTVVTDAAGGAIFSTVFTPFRIATMSTRVGNGGANVIAGSVSGGASTFLGQSADVVLANQQGYDWSKVAFSTVVGGGAGWLGGTVNVNVPVVSGGRGNWASTFQGVNTRIMNNNASQYSVLTGAKGAVGEAVRVSGSRTIDKVADGTAERVRKQVVK